MAEEKAKERLLEHLAQIVERLEREVCDIHYRDVLLNDLKRHIDRLERELLDLKHEVECMATRVGFAELQLPIIHVPP